MTNEERSDAELRRVQRQVRALEGPALGVRDSAQEPLPYINMQTVALLRELRMYQGVRGGHG